MLRSLWKEGADILLVPNQLIAIGRRPSTTIKDLKCPRHHLDVQYDQNNRLARVKIVRKKWKGFQINGTLCKEEGILRHGDTLNVLPGKFAYRFEIPAKAMTTNGDVESVSIVQSDIDSASESTMNAAATSVNISTSQSAVNSLISTSPVNALISTSQWATMDSILSTAQLATLRKIKPGWTVVSDTLLIYIHRPHQIGTEIKIAGFDLDGTLITTRSGKVFPKDPDDWKIAFPSIPAKLKHLDDDGYQVIIFTNQGGISSGQGHSVEEFKKKLERILEKLGPDVVTACFVSLLKGSHRKPLTGMWEEYERIFHPSTPLDRAKCLYIGDAAGREGSGEGRNRKKDHSCSDRLFAMNLGVKFMTPEEFFLDRPQEPFTLPAFSPQALLDQRATVQLLTPPNARLEPPPDQLEVIVFVGYPASGKSQFYHNYLSQNGYAYVSRDDLKDWKKCVQMTAKYLKEKKSVVIDNTNPDKEARQRYIDVAKSNGSACRCFIMNCTYEQASHMNKFRHLVGTDQAHKNVNIVIMNTYRSKFQQPSIDEGFQEIVQVNFLPRFGNDRSEKLFAMYLVEK